MQRSNERARSAQIMPSFIRPASLIMFWFQGGSQTSWTSASSTPSIDKIFLFDPRQALIGCDSVTATQALCNYPLGSSRDCCLLPARNLDRCAIAAQCEFSVFVHRFKTLLLLCHR